VPGQPLQRLFVSNAPPTLLLPRLREEAQIRRRLVFVGRHQLAVGTGGLPSVAEGRATSFSTIFKMTL
jgi:hypothetical protein